MMIHHMKKSLSLNSAVIAYRRVTKSLNDRRYNQCCKSTKRTILKQCCNYYKLSLSLSLFIYLSSTTSQHQKKVFTSHQSHLIFTRNTKLNKNTNSTSSKFLIIENNSESRPRSELSAFLIKRVIYRIANGEIEMCKKHISD